MDELYKQLQEMTYVLCRLCNGDGYLEYQDEEILEGIECPLCKGTGRKSNDI